MIYLGLNNDDKYFIIKEYYNKYSIKKIYFITSNINTQLKFNINIEIIQYNDTIKYKVFYKLLQEINQNTLIIIDECLKNKNRQNLNYNCIRHFLQQTNHQIIFNYLPIIDSIDDLFILFDFDTKSKWKNKIDTSLLKNGNIIKNKIDICISKINVPIKDNDSIKYDYEKNKLIKNIGLKDPDTIPRNLYLFSGGLKFSYVLNNNKNDYFIGRNNRYKIKNFNTYKDSLYEGKNYIIFEFCHNFIDFINFINLTHQVKFNVLYCNLKIDQWYYDRYINWIKEINNVYSKI